MSDEGQRKGDASTSADPGADKAKPAWVDKDPFGGSPNKGASPAEEKVQVAPELQRPAPPAEPPPSPPKPAESAPGAPPPRRSTSEVRRADRGDDDDDRPPGRRWGGLPIWGWPLLALLLIVVLLISFDVRNHDRYQINCREARAADTHTVHLELQQGRRLPWPFGFETVGGPFKPLPLAEDADCRKQVFESRPEAETAFLDFMLAEIRRGQDLPAGADLKQLRTMVLQALAITRDEPHRTRRKEAEQALADIAYQQGRAGLSRVEQELRTALGHLQEARKRAADRYEDLDDWIDHLESLLRTLVPSPGGGTGRALIGPGVPGPMSAPAIPPPAGSLPPPAANAPSAPSPDAGAESSAPDARPTPGSGGILM